MPSAQKQRLRSHTKGLFWGEAGSWGGKPAPSPEASLTCDGHIGPGLLLSPGWHEHCDVRVAPLQKPVHGQQDAPAGEDLLVPMAAGDRKGGQQGGGPLQPLPWASPPLSGWGPSLHSLLVPTAPRMTSPGTFPESHLPTVRKHPGIWQHPLPMWGRVRLLATHLGVGERRWRLLVPAPPRLLGPGDTDVHRQTESPPSPRTEEKPDCSGLKFSPALTSGAVAEEGEGEGVTSPPPGQAGSHGCGRLPDAGGCRRALQFESERTHSFSSQDRQFPQIPKFALSLFPPLRRA